MRTIVDYKTETDSAAPCAGRWLRAGDRGDPGTTDLAPDDAGIADALVTSELQTSRAGQGVPRQRLRGLVQPATRRPHAPRTSSRSPALALVDAHNGPPGTVVAVIGMRTAIASAKVPAWGMALARHATTTTMDDGQPPASRGWLPVIGVSTTNAAPKWRRGRR